MPVCQMETGGSEMGLDLNGILTQHIPPGIPMNLNPNPSLNQKNEP